MARKTTTKRLGAALKHAGDLAAQIEASMPPPKPRRDKRVMVALSDKERARVAAFAESRGEPMAAAVRNLAIAALDAMDR